MARKSATPPPRSRRRFLGDTLRMAGAAGVSGLGLAGLARQGRARAATALRPPGALAEADFLGQCLRCGLCVRDCPYDILSLAGFRDDVPSGTPYFTARSGPCEMCEDIPCLAACPSGALDPALDDIDDARMGLAVLADQETCLAYNGIRCDVCYRVCPLMGVAITVDKRPSLKTPGFSDFIPTVHSDACTGCGKCEQACVLEDAAIRVLPPALIKGRAATIGRAG